MKIFNQAILAVCVLSAGSAFAQNYGSNGYDEGMNVGLQNDIYEGNEIRTPQQQKRRSNRSVVEVEEDQIAPPAQGVVILNSQTGASAYQGGSSAGAYQNQQLTSQPTTYVEASPLTASRADQLRQVRQNAEVQTEQKIVEKLEESRLEDEKRRSERLFGDRWKNNDDRDDHRDRDYDRDRHDARDRDNRDRDEDRWDDYGYDRNPQRPDEVNPTPQVVQVVAVEDRQKQDQDNSNKEEIQSAKSEIIEEIRKSKEEVVDITIVKPQPKYFIGLAGGVAEYGGVDNVQGNGAAGFSIGTLLPSNMIIEGSFTYSNYYIDEYWKWNFFKEMDQYNFNMAAKYSPLSGKFKPFVGVTAGYTYRNYTDRTPDTYDYDAPRDEEISSNSVDMGLLVGLDFLLSNDFALGFEYRYSRNLVNRSESDFINRGDEWRDEDNTTPIEELDYSIFTISGKYIF